MLKNVRLLLIACLLGVGLAHAKTPDTCSPAGVAKNKTVVRIVFEEILSRGRVDENEHIYHPDFVAHGPTGDAGRAEDRAASKAWRQVAPDLQMKVLRMVGECDMVAVHWAGSGTNTGAGNGLPATGKALSNLWGTTIFRLDRGLIREEWSVFDLYAMLKQLGLLPADAGATK